MSEANGTDNTTQVAEQGGEAAAAKPNTPAPELTDTDTKGVDNSASEGTAQDTEGTLLSNASEGKGESAETKTEEKNETNTGAPESYEDFTIPQGVSLDSKVTSAFSEVAKELDLSQEKAQAVIDKVSPILAQRQMEQIKEVTAQWREKSANDPEIGGVNFEKNLAHAARIRDKFAYNADGKMDADIAEFMQSPAGNHPGVLKLLIRAGKAFGEGGFPTGQPQKPKLKASDLYD